MTVHDQMLHITPFVWGRSLVLLLAVDLDELMITQVW